MIVKSFLYTVAATLVSYTAHFPMLANAADVSSAPDSAYINGKVYTVEDNQPWAEAVAIKDGRFVAVGSTEEIRRLINDRTKVTDLRGSFAMPGIHDVHVHPALVYTYEEAGELLFPEDTAPDDIIKLVQEFAKQNPDLAVIRGNKWATAAFPGGKATKEWLDPHFPDRAIYLIDETGHNAVINSAALKLAGITRDTPDPDYGVIDRDPKTGEPTGYLSEAAMFLIGQHVRRPDVAANYRAINRALEQIRAFGTTSLIDMLVGPNSLEAYRKLERDNKLNMRVVAAITMNDYQGEATSEKESEEILARRAELDSPLIDISMKYFADGTPLSRTALLLAPYADDPTTHGEMTIGPRQFDRIKQAHREEIPVRMHSTGDGTTSRLLDVIAEAREEDSNPELVHHIGHLLLVSKEDIPRFAELNVAAEFSPVFWHPTPIGDIAGAAIGSERYKRWMPIKEFVDAGATVAFGSDWPAGTPDADPWRGMESMITRKNPYDPTTGKLGEGIRLDQAVEVFTINGARTMMQDDETGSIEVGKRADFIILNHNLFEIPVTEIHRTQVLKTIFGGEVVFSRNN